MGRHKNKEVMGGSNVQNTGEITTEENGVAVVLHENHDNPTSCHTFFNPQMQTNREFVLMCLKVYCGRATEKQQSSKIKCLDAFGATGICGLQWVRHCVQDVEVTINDMNAVAYSTIKNNCKINKIEIMTDDDQFLLSKKSESTKHTNCPSEETASHMEQKITEGCLKGVDEKLNMEDVEEINGSNDKPRNGFCAELQMQDANVLMHSRQFHFIHLDPYGPTVQFLDAAFRNVYHQGIVVLTSTDVAALYGKCPQVTARNYSAHNVRCDYHKELAARIVLASAARAAARCNKGFEVLYTLAVDHFVQVAVRICRGAQQADNCLSHIHRLLHCQLCEEWALHPEHKTLIANPYSLLACNCHGTSQGGSAIELGPAWFGNLYNPDFIKQMSQIATDLKLSQKSQYLLQVMAEEAVCSSSIHLNITKANSSSRYMDACSMETKNEPDPIEGKICEDFEHCRLNNEQQTDSNNSQSVQMENGSPGKDEKDSCISRQYKENQMPFLYYNLHRRKLKILPKSEKLIEALRTEDYRGSRTHFHPNALRTSATLHQLQQVIYKHFQS